MMVAMTPMTTRKSNPIIHLSVATYYEKNRGRISEITMRNKKYKICPTYEKASGYSEIDLPTNFLHQLSSLLD